MPYLHAIRDSHHVFSSAPWAAGRRTLRLSLVLHGYFLSSGFLGLGAMFLPNCWPAWKLLRTAFRKAGTARMRRTASATPIGTARRSSTEIASANVVIGTLPLVVNRQAVAPGQPATPPVERHRHQGRGRCQAAPRGKKEGRGQRGEGRGETRRPGERRREKGEGRGGETACGPPVPRYSGGTALRSHGIPVLLYFGPTAFRPFSPLALRPRRRRDRMPE